MQIKTTVRSHSKARKASQKGQSERRSSKKNLQTINTEEGMEKKKTSYTGGGNVN